MVQSLGVRVQVSGSEDWGFWFSGQGFVFRGSGSGLIRSSGTTARAITGTRYTLWHSRS